VKTAGLRAVIALLSILLVLHAGLAPSLARCASGPSQGHIVQGAGGAAPHQGPAEHAASLAAASIEGWVAAESGPLSGNSCCIMMMSCAPPGIAMSPSLRIRTGELRTVTESQLTLEHSSRLTAPESPPPKV
jgi:hypothetical protein